MNADRLLALYDRVADAPDAVVRLRRFVLDLAVRGKLVEQDPTDEPAVEMLKRIVAEKAQLVKAGAIKPQRTGKNRTPSPARFALPMGWEWASLQAVCMSITDGDHLPPPKAKQGVPFLVISNVRTQTINYRSERWVSRSYYEALDPSRQPRPGDLLYTLVGSFGIPVEVLDAREFCVQRHIGIIRPAKWISSPFLARMMASQFIFSQANACATGIAQKTVPLSGLRSLLVPLPPIAEQRRIVAKVDEFIALCDRLEETHSAREETLDRLTTASLARLSTPDADDGTFRAHARFAVDALPALTARADQIGHLRKTIFNLAVRGKLVEQDPGDEPASELLTQIAKHKKQREASVRHRRTTSSEPLHVDDMPFNLPASWIWARFGDITICRDGERIPVSKSERQQREKTYDYYGASGIIDKIDSYLFDEPLLLIGEDGANLINRSTPIAFIARGKYWVNNHAHVLDGLSDEYLRYIELFINATDLKPFVTGTAQPKMNQTKMNSIPVALPPLGEQNRIVVKVDQLMALCDRLEAGLAASDATRVRLLASLLHEALTPTANKNLASASPPSASCVDAEIAMKPLPDPAVQSHL